MASVMSSTPRKTASKSLFLLLATLLLSAAIVSAQETGDDQTEAEGADGADGAEGAEGEVEETQCKATGTPCKAGVVLPIWRPDGMTLGGGDKAARAVVYFAGMIFLFLGISIIADKFMSAIETITSQEKDVKVKLPNGEVTVITVAIWNETVSNLTLMALGSSAPEILLSVIEICGSTFVAGDLGPGTIVGSAAFNLFVIIGICILVIPDGEVRYQKHLPVFFCTATWSIWAYVWLYLIIAVISPNRVDIWEAVLTLIYFPLTVCTAYICDQQIFFKKFISKRYRAKGTTIVASEGDVEMQEQSSPEVQYDDPQVAEFEKQRAEYIAIMRDLRKKNPDAELEQIEAMAQNEMLNRSKKSRAYYRIAATRKITGGGAVKRREVVAEEQAGEAEAEGETDNITRIFFDPGHYSVMENCGSFMVTVTREGGDLTNTVYVDYRTEDGTANAGGDYEYAEGTLVFHPTETHKQFPISVMDDDVFEEDEHFYIRLSNIRVGGADGMFKSVSGADAQVQLANPSFATVLILDDDHAGFFGFDTREIEVVESIGEVNVKFTRASGARGKVNLPFRCVDGSAKAGAHFEDVSGEVSFEDNQYEQHIKIGIVDEEVYEKNMYFAIEVDEPKWAFRDEKAGLESLAEEEKKVAELGAPRLGEITKLIIRIRESKEFKGTVDKLLKKTNMSIMVGASSWKDQFVEAFSVSAGDDDEEGEDGEEGEEALPSCMDYTMHFLTFFWKVAFATVPPCEYWSGWACFIVSILQIGVCTAIVGDVASHLGCTIGLKDTVTAITFVALGTSVPDTFASKVAAVQDEYADSSIGNVTGSNGVNVFLGIGVAWSMASIYHAAKGTEEGFRVNPGSLGFCLTVFCILAVVAILLLVIRRSPIMGGGELGGPPIQKKICATMFFGFWFLYVVLSALEQYCHIQGF